MLLIFDETLLTSVEEMLWSSWITFIVLLRVSFIDFPHSFHFLSFSLRLYFPVLTLPPSKADTSFISLTKTLIKLSRLTLRPTEVTQTN